MFKRLIACSNISVVSARLIALNSNKAKTEGDWNVIAVTGEWKGHRAGPFKLTVDDLNTIVSNFKNSKANEIVVDYEHMSLYGSQAEAAGWIKELKVEGEELKAKIEWLADAKEQIKSKKYKYISPVLDPHTVDQVSGGDIGWSLHSCALTNKPFFEELPELIANKNTTQSKKEEDKVDIEELKKELEKANTRIKDLEDENKKLKEDSAKSKVDAAVAAKKIQEDQVDEMLAFSLSNPDGFDKFIEKAKPQENPFNGDGEMFAGSHRQGGGNKNQEYNVLKMIGAE